MCWPVAKRFVLAFDREHANRSDNGSGRRRFAIPNDSHGISTIAQNQLALERLF